MVDRKHINRSELPDTYITPSLSDWILTGISALIVLVMWILFAMHYQELSARSNDNLINLIVVTVFTIFLLFMHRISVRWVNLPFRITEQNVWRQYRIALTMVRIVILEINTIFFSLFMGLLVPSWAVYNDSFQLIILGVIMVTISIYLTIAYKLR